MSTNEIPRIQKVEGRLKEHLETILKRSICPLALRETYPGPWGMDFIFYDCQEGGEIEPTGLPGLDPCSMEYARTCPTYQMENSASER